MVDWRFKGRQEYRVRRGCSSKPAEECWEGQSSTGQASFKDCQVDCKESNCNTGLDEVAALYDSGKNQESCYTCSYIESSNGDVEGEKVCGDGSEQLKDGIRTCPTYANYGCYTGTNVHYSAGSDSKELEEVYKGCSSFEAKDPFGRRAGQTAK